MEHDFLHHFILMGGYALYVWLAYGMTGIVLVLNILLPLYHFRRLWQALSRRLQPLR